VLGRLSIAPTQGIVEVVGHGTGVTGTVAVPPRLCAASVVELPRLCAGSGTPPLRLLAVTVLVLAGSVPRSPEHVVSAWVVVDGDVDVCNVDSDWTAGEPRPVVPSPVVPRPLAPTPVTPRFPAFAELLAVAVVELPRLDDADEADEFALGAVVVAEIGALVTPELLTELHGVDVLLSAPTPEVVKLVVGLSPPLVGLSPPPSKADNPVAPEPPLVQGVALATPANGAGVVWELLPGVWPKSAPSGDVAPTLGAPVCAALGKLPGLWLRSAPSGDVAPMPPRLGVSVCAALWPRPSAVMERIMAVMRKDFIGAAASFAFHLQHFFPSMSRLPNIAVI
jgi:hypothetical protein